MIKMLSILLLLSASAAEASVQSFKADETATLRPVSLQERQSHAKIASRQTCNARPVLLFLRMPDGATRLIGILRRNDAC